MDELGAGPAVGGSVPNTAARIEVQSDVRYQLNSSTVLMTGAVSPLRLRHALDRPGVAVGPLAIGPARDG